ncbi:hypothetical protein AXG93_1406s1060 [Marchantia polymorpha subsp. ruderalis]|uniref:Glycoside hydrolase family 19 catalytic domain-containing protein n=1 Tax=Marchantia polymorpha subsp. ruderalis TaxID=1480154 RepID=A0A176W0A9_MARPO|nr:hypothetical protein AXG93_1406s1060 [Marchantia polymorpha subsp. ruderalis]
MEENGDSNRLSPIRHFRDVVTAVLNTDASNEVQVLVPTEEQGSNLRATEMASSSDNRLNDALFVLYEPPDGLPYDTEIIFVHDVYTERWLSRLNDDFRKLRQFMKDRRNSNDLELWKVLTICESDRTPGALGRSVTFVPEASCRPDCDYFWFGNGDHFDVCKHQSTGDAVYQSVEEFLDKILKSDKLSSPNSIPEFDPTADENIWKALLPREVFIDLFPNRNRFYTYEAFTEAAMTFIRKGFLVDGSVEDQTREIAALLAHFDHGTSGLLYKEHSCPSSTYCDPQIDYPCVPGKSYHGRGPLQLCWNYNYKMCGEGIEDDSLLSCPEKLSQDPVIAFKSALWFWCTPQWNKPSCHSVMTGKWTPESTDIEANRLPGFGLTINIINGIECNKESAEANSRVEKYKKFCERLHVDPGENIDCRYQKPFGQV